MQPDGKRGGARGGRGRGRGAGRGKRGRRVVSSDEEVPEPAPIPGNTNTEAPAQVAETSAVAPVQPMEVVEAETTKEVENTKKIDIETDISQLEAPKFTTITRGPPEPMVRLKWTHKVMLIGEKVLNPMIHSCDTCLLPILHYGRMIPCKHVFCLMCAKREPKECPRCKEKVCRVEQSGLGTVFMCTHGGSRYNNKGCRRTYLSHRDLQAHINHRHISIPAAAARRIDETAVVPEKLASGTPLGRKSIGNTTPSATSGGGGPALSNVRTNLHKENPHESDGHFSSRHPPRYSNSHFESSSGGNWSSNNYR